MVSRLAPVWHVTYVRPGIYHRPLSGFRPLTVAGKFRERLSTILALEYVEHAFRMGRLKPYIGDADLLTMATYWASVNDE